MKNIIKIISTFLLALISIPTLASTTETVAVTASEVGFISGAIGFISGFILSWPTLVVLSILGILFERADSRGWAVFMAIIIAILSIFIFNVSLVTLGIGIIVYTAVGLLWSFWRYKRHVSSTIADNKGVGDEWHREQILRNLHPKKMLGTITAWIIIWPFSMTENVVGDLIDIIQSLVTKVFNGIYMKIYNSAVRELK